MTINGIENILTQAELDEIDRKILEDEVRGLRARANYLSSQPRPVRRQVRKKRHVRDEEIYVHETKKLPAAIKINDTIHENLDASDSIIPIDTSLSQEKYSYYYDL